MQERRSGPLARKSSARAIRSAIPDRAQLWILFDKIEGSITIKDEPGLQEWRGRFWLPEGSPVEPGGNYSLVRDDGRAGEPIVDRSESGTAGGDLAVF